MKYGESSFDILYLLFAIVGGILILARSRTKVGKMMGSATLILGLGDSFHLVPRVLNYFVEGDFALFLGVGKLITSVTMTVFYVLLYFVWAELYKAAPNKKLTAVVIVLAAVRIALCAFPQNGWFTNTTDMTWAILRNVPFIALGAVVCVLLFQKRKEIKSMRPTWIYVLLSFIFYIPVAIFASLLPILGMLMLPKTICYVLTVVAFMLTQKEQNV